MLPLFLGKLVAIHLIHIKFIGFEDRQQILQPYMGLSVVERLKTYDAENVVSTFLGCFQSNPFRFREAGKHGQEMCKYSQFQQVSNRSGIEAKSPSSVIFRRFGSLVDVSGTVVW